MNSEGFDESSFAWKSLIGQPGPVIKTALLSVHFVVGVPPATLGSTGDIAFRLDGTAGANTKAYSKDAGTWTAWVTA